MIVLTSVILDEHTGILLYPSERLRLQKNLGGLISCDLAGQSARAVLVHDPSRLVTPCSPVVTKK